METGNHLKKRGRFRKAIRVGNNIENSNKMVTNYVRHRVADFKKWKSAFDQHDATRKQYGCKKSEIFTNVESPNDVLVVLEWESKEHAAKFDASSNLKETMQHSGVISEPEFSFAE
jgi:heme-degrading monooxygenase HmoA